MTFTSSLSFFFNDTATTEIYTLSLHDALPIYLQIARHFRGQIARVLGDVRMQINGGRMLERLVLDRKSTRLNSSHRCISYAVFCLKKKNNGKCRALVTG